MGATEETDEAGQSWAGELWRLSVCKQVWSLQVLVQLMIMHGELDMENMEIQWTTVAREYCQRHFNLDGNYRCSWREIYIWLSYHISYSGLSWEKWSWRDNIWGKSMKLVNSFALKLNSWFEHDLKHVLILILHDILWYLGYSIQKTSPLNRLRRFIIYNINILIACYHVMICCHF